MADVFTRTFHARWGDMDFNGHMRNTAYLDGDVANRKAGIVLSTSDFWPMVQGTNTIHPEGCDIDVLWQSAWV